MVKMKDIVLYKKSSRRKTDMVGDAKNMNSFLQENKID